MKPLTIAVVFLTLIYGCGLKEPSVITETEVPVSNEPIIVDDNDKQNNVEILWDSAQ